MTLAEAVAVVRDQTIPTLEDADGGFELSLQVEALRVLVEWIERYESMERVRAEYREHY